VAVTPDAIERRTFAIADWGYDRGEVHQFLVEMAAVLRAAQRGIAAAAGHDDGLQPLRADAVELVDGDGKVDRSRLGEKISQLLETAELQAADMRADAEQALLVARSNAEQEAADRRREAEADAETIREQAKHVLISSQEQAERIVAEAEAHAESLRQAADERASARNERLQRVAERHAERVLRFERDAVARLREAQGDVQQAIERLTGSESSPVLDLSGGQPSVRVGALDVSTRPALPARSGAVDDRPTRRRVAERSTERTSDDPNADAVNRLVRAAVDRAVEHAGQVVAPPRVPGSGDASRDDGTDGERLPSRRVDKEPEARAERPSPADSSV
jgi:hypothetical protein